MKIKALIFLSLICVNFSFSQSENCNQFQKKVAENMEESFLSNLSDELSNLSNGVWCVYYNSNDMFLQFSINDGKLSGHYMVYYPGNKMKILREYKNGVLDGTAVMWGENSNIWTISEVVNGAIIRQYLFNEDQKVEKIIEHYGKNPGTKVLSRPKRVPRKYEKYIMN